MSKKVIPITLLTGYLGAGKTTLLNYVLNNKQNYKVAVIVNDIGEVNIDANLIGKDNVVSTVDDSLVPLQNGCICCNLKEDLMKQIAELVASGKFDYILIEASGICEPVPIVQSITVVSEASEEYNLPATCKLDNVVSVVDALRLATEYGQGSKLLDKNIGEEDIENLIIQQIEFCTTVILNKCDQVSESEKNLVKAVIKELQPEAEIIESNFGVVPIDKIMGTNLFDFEKTCASAGWMKAMEKRDDDLEDDHHEDHDEDEHHNHGKHHEEHEHHHDHEESEHHCHKEDGEHHCHHHHEDGEECHCHHHECDENDGNDHSECEHGHCKHHHCHCHNHGEEEYGISTFVYYRRKPIVRSKFRSFVSEMPKNIIRTKGIMWFSNDNENMYIFEQAGVQKSSFKADVWIDTLPENEKKQYIEYNPDIKKDWDSEVGDRMVKLVFIGQKMDKEKIISDLDKCLDN